MERTPNYRFATEKPDHIMLSISGDARYSMTVTWRMCADIESGYVEYYEKDGEKKTVEAIVKPFKSDVNTSNIFFARIENLKQGSDFAKKLGVENVATHVGFLPETPNTEQYHSVVCAIRTVAQYCKDNGQYFLFETGQETPVTLRRTIEDVGTGNLGINLDPANLILYGKANPIDALDVFGEYVRDVHAKDGCYPADGKNLGKEKPLGEGKVNFPALVKKLKEIGYDGPLSIEREITGEKQKKDIIMAKTLLEKLI